MASLSVNLHLYRLENVPDGTTYGTNRVSAVWPTDVEIRNIRRVTPVNATGGPDLTGTPFLYTKLTMETPGLLQESYVMQSVAQMHTLINA